ncbi:sensor histidine kinase [Marinobacter zhanjiangensis]|uniref:histidine kinase n=1 Tax=Marinobacter zhanjiangensis TaxID=578215 RepID=A0ABQ3B021_9GAMM|nr:ATP-binding protein [Marinobacter zhanjiangensis]GGY71811.1 hypothetical protein GCM10007071_18500 [Marinobacter zhanjiangensis]
MRNLSLGGRIVLITVGISLLSLAVILVIAYQQLVSDFEQVLTERQRVEAQRYAIEVDQALELRLLALEGLALQLTDGQRRLPENELQTILERQSSVSKYFEAGLLVFDEKAVAIAENRFVPGRLGTSYADRHHFRKAMVSEEPVISRPIVGRTTGLPLLSFLYPILSDDGDLLGFAGGIVNLKESSILPRPEQENTEIVFNILDTESFTLVDSLESDRTMPPLPEPGENLLIDAALSGISSGVVTDASGERWVYATRHLQRVGWQFLRAAPYREVTEPARASFLQFLTISMLSMILIIILAVVLSRATTQPLRQIAARMREMTEDPSAKSRLPEFGAPEIRNVVRAFNRLAKEREALDDMKDQFVSTVSHELRTPLTSIGGSLKLLQGGAAGELPPKARSMVDLAMRNSDQLQLLISDLLDFNKAIAGQMTLAIQTVNARAAIERACQGNRSTASARSINFVIEADPSQEVQADPHRLRQILDNFISNALKFSPEGSSVTISATPTENNSVRLTVADQGEGVPKGFLPRLFQRFAQAEHHSERAYAGTGLGLAISRELATLMGGRVGYHFDHGARFWVELPVGDTKTEPGEANEGTG